MLQERDRVKVLFKSGYIREKDIYNAYMRKTEHEKFFNSDETGGKNRRPTKGCSSIRSVYRESMYRYAIYFASVKTAAEKIRVINII